MSSLYQDLIKKQYENQGYKVAKLAKVSGSGWPDLMCLKNGTSVFIECKEANDTLKPLQKYKIDELIKLGFEAFCMQDGKGKIYPVL